MKIEALSIRIVQEAPSLDPVVIGELRAELMAIGSPLALAIARIYEYTGEGLVDVAIALPALAEACATLVAGIDGRVDERVLDAARYQIDTLEPMPDRPAPRAVVPDVPLAALRKR